MGELQQQYKQYLKLISDYTICYKELIRSKVEYKRLEREIVKVTKLSSYRRLMLIFTICIIVLLFIVIIVLLFIIFLN